MGEHYNHLIQQLVHDFGQRLKTLGLFGSQAREEAEDTSDHDLFLMIDGLSEEPVKRLKTIRQVIAEVPLRINTIAKTPAEAACNQPRFFWTSALTASVSLVRTISTHIGRKRCNNLVYSERGKARPGTAP